MTTRLYYILLICFASFLLFGCGSDESGEPVVETEKTIVLDKDTIDLQVDKNITAQIMEGNGNYNAFSLNDDIAAVTLNGNKLEIQAKNIGSTNIIISDKYTQLKLLPVTVYQYDKITLEKETADIEFKLGNKKTIQVNVLESNGECSATSEDEAIATVQGFEDFIVITTQGKEGSTNIVITDESKRRAIVQVNTKSTVIPYDEEELEEIMKKTAVPTFVFKDQQSYTYFTFLNTVENGMNVSGYDYYNGFYALNIYYPGDKSAEEKQGCKISYTNVPYGQSSDGTVNLEYFKIIKNDGTKIWAVYSLIENNALKWGYFIQNINP
jgi:hypothetical protein